ncbi:hypothetical protein [Ilumatobacter sp.]|uniref:hypothetical protein n=1 Tax=Ilumatobacter sp. TaxID=1967498 RepID=UPI003C649063
MRTTITACLAASLLVLAACGGSDADTSDSDPGDTVTTESDSDDSTESSGALDGEQGRVADLLMSGAADSGIELDEDCVNENVGQLTDDDAQAIADAGLTGEVEVSPEADAIGDTVFSDCIDAESYAIATAEAMGDVDETVDVDCLKDALSGLTPDEIDDQLFDEAASCITGE